MNLKDYILFCEFLLSNIYSHGKFDPYKRLILQKVSYVQKLKLLIKIFLINNNLQVVFYSKSEDFFEILANLNIIRLNTFKFKNSIKN